MVVHTVINKYNQTTANEIVGLVKACRGRRGHRTYINKAYKTLLSTS